MAVDIWYPGLGSPFTLALVDTRFGRDDTPQLFVAAPGGTEGRLLLRPELTGDEDDAVFAPDEPPPAPERPLPAPDVDPGEIEVWPVPIRPRPRRRRWRFLLLSVSELSAELYEMDGDRFFSRAIQEMTDVPPGTDPVRVTLTPWMLSEWGGNGNNDDAPGSRGTFA